MRHRYPKDSILSQSANDKFLAELRRMREAVLDAQGQLRRGAPLSRALDTLLIDMDDIAFIVTGNRDHFTRPMPPYTKRLQPEYRKARHELTNLEGHAGLDKQIGMARDPEEE